MEFEDGFACRGLRVGVVPDAVAAAQNFLAWRFASTSGGFCGSLVVEERGNLSQVEICQQDRDEYLSCAEAADATSGGLFNVFLNSSHAVECDVHDGWDKQVAGAFKKDP